MKLFDQATISGYTGTLFKNENQEWCLCYEVLTVKGKFRTHEFKVKKLSEEEIKSITESEKHYEKIQSLPKAGAEV